jgi:hypothetical protein
MEAQSAPPSAWLDMSLYPDLPPDGALPSQALAAVHAALCAPEPPTVAADAWQAAVDGAGKAVRPRGGLGGLAGMQAG